MTAAESPPPTPALAPAWALQVGQSMPLGPNLCLVRDDEQFVYFLFLQPIASHALDDKAGRNRCLGRCALYGYAPQTVLAEAFGMGIINLT